jgi:ribosome biogenesis protein ENP2
MFENPDFEVDKSTEEYRLLKPLLTQLDKSKLKKLEKQFEEAPEKDEKEGSSDEDFFGEKDESSDDDNKWTEEVSFYRISVEI